MALRLTPGGLLTAADEARIAELAAMDDEAFTTAVEDHLRLLTEDSRRPLWAPALAPRTRDALARLATSPGGGRAKGLGARARAEHNLISAALALAAES
ncbi:hypothetical protein BKA00_004466 [Actinomadura coerulea]|uniref:Uncharacterized protein n=1 Tax=Actinomadura coerulea TaxID=46159 RepID=A0A7X0G2F3_9ACTN|nr:hypothetical protein [Actinomadura coerulea]MBB6397552.1 hypothetical protein [Actinomadura coerulea]GGQ03401.1 hypothetical protein GCM10010187_19190 [Actinomadura coerulea]